MAEIVKTAEDVLSDLNKRIESIQKDSSKDTRRWINSFGAICGAISTAGIIGLFSFTYSSNAATVELQTQVRVMQQQITGLTTQVGSMQQNYVTHTDFDSIDNRVRLIEIQIGPRYKR